MAIARSLAVEVERVEVEMEVRSSGVPASATASVPTMMTERLLDEVVDRGQELVAGRLALRRRLDEVSSAGRMVIEQEGDDHAGAGDLAQFGHAAVGGRQEGVEAAAVAAAASASGPPDLGRAQRCARMNSGFEALRLVADAELDAEVDADADEQHGEGDRDEVEGPHQQQGRRRR